MVRVQAVQSAGAVGMHRHPAYATVQAAEREDILNIGGFSDQVFQSSRLRGRSLGADHWVGEIESLQL
jgi:60 kDa SS-A/Ro ribonucleoprotein